MNEEGGILFIGDSKIRERERERDNIFFVNQFNKGPKMI